MACNGTNNTDYTVNGTTNVVVKTNGKTVTATAKDIMGNMITASLTVTNIDKVAPTIAFGINGASNVTMPTSGNATIKTTATVSDTGGSGIYASSFQYIWSQSTTAPSSGWTAFTNGSTITKNNVTTAGTWYLWTRYNDNARNNTGTTQVVSRSNAFVVTANTDAKNKITLTANITSWTNGDVTVSVNYGANLTQSKTLSCNGTNGTDYTVNGTSNVVVKTNGRTVTATAKDVMGNMITASLTISNIDKVVPATPSITNPTNGNWTNRDFSLAVASSDALSGISYWQYSYDQTNWSTYENSASNNFTTTAFSAERNQLVYIRCVDRAGNASGVSSTWIRIDKTGPSKTSVNLNGYASGSWTTGNITQTFSATDTQSGVAYYQYSHDGVNVAGNVPNPWVISWDGEWNFFIRAVDNVGNAGAWSNMYTVRRTTPVQIVTTASTNSANTASFGVPSGYEQGTYIVLRRGR